MHRSIEDTFAIQHYLEIHFWMYPQSSIENTFIVLAENSESIFVLRLVVNLGMLKLWWGLKSDFGEETKISPQTICVWSVLKLWRGVKSDFGEKDFTSDKLWWDGGKVTSGKRKRFYLRQLLFDQLKESRKVKNSSVRVVDLQKNHLIMRHISASCLHDICIISASFLYVDNSLVKARSTYISFPCFQFDKTFSWSFFWTGS